ncbi:hypothetical protein TRFO_04147 [Tritrichomonas foetus]|uniref:Uncharacterized protein n=1 Tax=Tritrichomonas foetus TaxID=1144522 RepID=A0A1J4KGV8_9EUKA|nr:hypothetical protein TRFO_04147 [Tritrichomonas foetus]|eukprot:OHT10647.1 hypothetical protein TRFO_04147 [Tritrichomonas foetus]
MSVREKPVASRLLDLKEKERAYSRHVTAVVRARATINTTQPDTPRRLLVAANNNAKYRRSLKREYDNNARKVRDLSRPQSQQTRRIVHDSNITSPHEIDIFADPLPRSNNYNRPPVYTPQANRNKYLYNLDYKEDSSVSDLMTSETSKLTSLSSASNNNKFTGSRPSSAASSTRSTSSSLVSPYLTEPKRNKQKTKIDRVKIGYAPQAIVESVEVDEDELSSSRRSPSRKSIKDMLEDEYAMVG